MSQPDDYMASNPMSGNFSDTSPEAQRLRRERRYFDEAQGVVPARGVSVDFGNARVFFGVDQAPAERCQRILLRRALRFVLDELHRVDELPPG